jgi:hypothetical protein
MKRTQKYVLSQLKWFRVEILLLSAEHLPWQRAHGLHSHPDLRLESHAALTPAFWKLLSLHWCQFSPVVTQIKSENTTGIWRDLPCAPFKTSFLSKCTFLNYSLEHSVIVCALTTRHRPCLSSSCSDSSLWRFQLWPIQSMVTVVQVCSGQCWDWQSTWARSSPLAGRMSNHNTHTSRNLALCKTGLSISRQCLFRNSHQTKDPLPLSGLPPALPSQWASPRSFSRP